ncbi:MAG: AEC family transporter [Pseudomonadota bacterium]
MIGLLQVVIPVFLVAGAGYVAVRLRYFSDSVIDGLNVYTQRFAIPVLLFRAAMDLDLRAVFDPGLLLSFYTGAAISFALGIVGARLLFRRRPGEAVAIGFGALFSNSVILGIPIVERAFGQDALTATFAIVSIHAPFCYLLGITVMEISRADGRGPAATARAVVRAMLHNALMIGLALGFAVNLSGLVLPEPARAGVDLVAGAASPVALFGLGGVLTRYRVAATLGPVAMVAGLSLIVHPGIAYGLAVYVFDLSPVFTQAAVLTAAMAPGVNTYVFATLYSRAEDVAASAVLVATALSVLTISVWLSILAAV